MTRHRAGERGSLCLSDTHLFETEYGYFTSTGDEYVIARPDTPRPWVNVLSNGRYGLVISQTGSGYSWLDHASLNRITRWEQDLVKDGWGKYIYLRDNQAGRHWSVGWKPVCSEPQEYECRHGLGYTIIRSRTEDITSEMTVFVPQQDPLEVWRLKIRNGSDRSRDLSLFTYFEWLLGAAPDWHREFHRTFFDVRFGTEDQVFLVTKRLWEARTDGKGHWNTPWDGVAFHAANVPVSSYEADKETFLGMYRTETNPLAVAKGKLSRTVGRWLDPVSSLQVDLAMEPGESRTVIFVLGVGSSDAHCLSLVENYRDESFVDESLTQAVRKWLDTISQYEVDTPDEAFNLMTNIWLKYQAISGRLLGRTAYYQTGGAYGFRDQLQDSQVYLEWDPDQTKRQILLHAAHQWRDGYVYHWWHPINETGLVNKISDNRNWLVFVTCHYIQETGDYAILDTEVPFVDGGLATLLEHCCRALDYTLERRSERGLPLIGGGDWNDGMSAAGLDGRGESVWLAHFLVYILHCFSEVCKHYGDKERCSRYEEAADEMVQAVNRHAWDGSWFIRATLDDGTSLGSADSDCAKIFLNPQTWSVIAGSTPLERQLRAMKSVEQWLDLDYGPILFYPAWQTPDSRVGYLTRYAPGIREHAGVYTHAATWAIQAECLLGKGDRAFSMYRRICPPLRGMNPDLYKAEPYVSPGNVDGPDSPNFGRGGWTWYTGSAAWLFRIGSQYILGVRPCLNGLLVDPVIPSEWKEFRVKRIFRGAVYEISVENPEHVCTGVRELWIDGRLTDGNVIPPHCDGKLHKVRVVLGM